jgi:hypothetical protein
MRVMRRGGSAGCRSVVFGVQAERPRPKRAKHGHSTTPSQLPQAKELNGGWWLKLPRPPLHDLHIRKYESKTIPENSTRHSSRAYVASNNQPANPDLSSSIPH